MVPSSARSLAHPSRRLPDGSAGKVRARPSRRGRPPPRQRSHPRPARQPRWLGDRGRRRGIDLLPRRGRSRPARPRAGRHGATRSTPSPTPPPDPPPPGPCSSTPDSAKLSPESSPGRSGQHIGGLVGTTTFGTGTMTTWFPLADGSVPSNRYVGVADAVGRSAWPSAGSRTLGRAGERRRAGRLDRLVALGSRAWPGPGDVQLLRAIELVPVAGWCHHGAADEVGRRQRRVHEPSEVPSDSDDPARRDRADPSWHHRSGRMAEAAGHVPGVDAMKDGVVGARAGPRAGVRLGHAAPSSTVTRTRTRRATPAGLSAASAERSQVRRGPPADGRGGPPVTASTELDVARSLAHRSVRALTEPCRAVDLEDLAGGDPIRFAIGEQRIQDQASSRDAPRQLGQDHGPGVARRREQADDLVRWDQPKLVADRIVDLDLEPVRKRGPVARRKPLKSTISGISRSSSSDVGIAFALRGAPCGDDPWRLVAAL